MGLDITAVRQPQFVHSLSAPEHDDDACEEHDYTLVYSNETFTDWQDGVPEGCYIFPEDEGQTVHFNAGSYSGYSHWRKVLSHITLGVDPKEVWDNPSDYQGKSFYELINMSGCEGFIGPITSKKLADDFEVLLPDIKEHLEQFNSELDLDAEYMDYWLRKFQDWHAAFKLASDTGLVKFH